MTRPTKIEQIALQALEDTKAKEIESLNVRKLTTIADTMIVCSGTSKQHLRSMANRIVEYAKAAGFKPLGVEGEQFAEWILVDLGDVIVHLMMPETRAFYSLEKLWTTSSTRVKRPPHED